MADSKPNIELQKAVEAAKITLEKNLTASIERAAKTNFFSWLWWWWGDLARFIQRTRIENLIDEAENALQISLRTKQEIKDDSSDPVKTYLKRYQSQRDYFSRASGQNKNSYIRLMMVSIITGSLVPILINIELQWWVFTSQGLATILSVVTVIATGYESLQKYGDNWRIYRTTSERLKRERALYDVHAKPYDMTDENERIRELALHCEEIIQQEVSTFSSRMAAMGKVQDSGKQ